MAFWKVACSAVVSDGRATALSISAGAALSILIALRVEKTRFDRLNHTLDDLIANVTLVMRQAALSSKPSRRAWHQLRRMRVG
jgi:hypothetical protein